LLVLDALNWLDSDTFVPMQRDVTIISAFAILAIGVGACSSGGNGSPPDGGSPPPGDPPFEPSALYVLGDSLSDAGNAAAGVDFLLGLTVRPPTIGLCNPTDIALGRDCGDLVYERSRVSDGRVAVEHLGDVYGFELEPSLHLIPGGVDRGTNYAIAGAKADGVGVGDLTRQVDALLLNEGALSADALYVVMIGGNDAIDALQAAALDAAAADAVITAIVTAAIDGVRDALERLLDSGARRIVVANIPDLAIVSGIVDEASMTTDPESFLELATELSSTFATELDAVLTELRTGSRWTAPSPTLVEFDLMAALGEVAAEISDSGGNVTDACFDSEKYRSSDNAERVFHADCAPVAGSGPRFADFLFWDRIHPTGRAHALLGQRLSATVLSAF